MQELIAIIDDEPDIRQLVEHNLQKAGYRVWSCGSASELFSWLVDNRPDLLVLDLMLPDIDGLEICKRLRNTPIYANLPIIMLTARGEEFDRVLGLELGADDYLTKPFSTRELVARIKAILRRQQPSADEAGELRLGGIVLNRSQRTVRVDNRPIALTNTEFNLLALLLTKPGHVFSREQLLDHLWGEDKIVITRSIDVHIRHLREKLGVQGTMIKNIRGVGYKLEP